MCISDSAPAGHDRPFLVRDGAVQTLGGRGMALGLFGADTFYVTEERLTLRPGDRLVLYTDGLSDVVDPAGAMFHGERLKALVLRPTAQAPDEFRRALFYDPGPY